VQLNRKSALSAVMLMGGLLVVLVGVSLVAFREFSIRAAQADAQTAAEIVRVALTESMLNGTIKQREQLLNRLGQVQGLKSARVVRGPQVAAQFGPGLSLEQGQDDVESSVLATGKPWFGIVEEGMQPVFRSTIPYVASRNNTPNCMQCHQVPEGAVLGAITLELSVPGLKSTALFSVGLMVLTVGVFGIAMLLLLRRMARPLVTTAHGVQEAVGAALQGNFDVHVKPQTDDEIGQIARDFNHLNRFLNQELATIRNDVAEVIQFPAREGDSRNLMTNTRRMVQGLVAVARFKNAVEEDETRHEVYRRLTRAIREELALEQFAIYEVASSKNRLIKVVCAEEEGQPACDWCDQQVLVRSEACRARRTGHSVDSIEFPAICSQFRPGKADVEHICIPVIQSGTVGSVVQLIVPRERGHEVQRKVPFFHIYLREAAPVLEAKRLMDTLRESNLRDAMTGLHNRRFLEEYVETLVANTQRRQTNMSLLMLDLDYFKKVNDTHGHDAGDTVLKTLAKILQQSVRRSDLVIRYGGEEFLIILLDTTNNYAVEVAEKIRAAVEETRIRLPGAVLEKTISIGVADFPRDSDTFWQAIKFADVALYRAKELGRNRVVHFAPEMWKGGDSEY
jgi:diguanylate cyclase (GGDEF)-like protein